MNKTKVYYQPYLHIDQDIPEELMSFQAFRSKDDLHAWMRCNGYAINEYGIDEYHDEDIEGVAILDADGECIEVND
jgi:hypothetical protein